MFRLVGLAGDAEFNVSCVGFGRWDEVLISSLLCIRMKKYSAKSCESSSKRARAKHTHALPMICRLQ